MPGNGDRPQPAHRDPDRPESTELQEELEPDGRAERRDPVKRHPIERVIPDPPQVRPQGRGG